MSQKLRNIVVGVGMGPEVDPVLRPAADLAASHGATLHVINGYLVTDPLLDAYARAGYLGEQTVVQFGQNIQAALLAQVESASIEGKVEARAVPGAPASAMLDRAAAVNAELIIVGSTRHGRLSASLLGSTSRAVLRRSELPVLMMRPGVSAIPRKVLAATDLSDLAAAALRHGLMLSAGSSRVTVRSVLVISDNLTMLPLEHQLLYEVAQKELAEFDRTVAPNESTESVVRRGDPATEILAEAADWAPDLIALGSHGRSGMDRFILGSVAESVLGRALCNVLVVPPSAELAG